ncbi:glycosyltransferase family 4 protein [Sorangium sp. So ce513]|uniref:glycosyltransferase family 4 protein n=1 Tax=Sorangium sp. So ce513 TaxID=3133315 RepID=UPI003F60FA5F
MTGPLRVGIAVPTLGYAGGVERHARDLAAALAARGHEVVLLHGALRGDDPEGYARGFCRAVPIDRPGCARDLDVVYAQRARRVEELAPFGDTPLVIASHDHELTCARTYRYLPLSLAPCDRAPGLACVAHGCCVVRDRRPGARVPVRVENPLALRSRLAGLAARAPIVACSRYVASNLLRAGVDPGRVRVVHPIPPEDPAPLAPRPAAPRLVVVGQLLRGKGVDIAIRALALLPADATLDVVGDGPSRGELKALAARAAPGRVRFHGRVAPEGLRARYDAASVAVVPARWPEPFGMTGIEAMRRARPVAGADHGGIPEWLEHGAGGLLFTPGSPESLAAAARALLADPGAGARAHAFAAARFPHARLVAEIEPILAGAALARGARRADGGARGGPREGGIMQRLWNGRRLTS